LQPDGHPGPIETAATHVLADDFAFGASGSLYIATHPETDGVSASMRREAARQWRGLSRAPSAPRRARSGARLAMRNVLYVTTDGGLVAPYEGAVQEAKLLRLEVGEAGWPLIGPRLPA